MKHFYDMFSISPPGLAMLVMLLSAGLISEAHAGGSMAGRLQLVPGTPEPVNPLESVARAQRTNVDSARREVARVVDRVIKLQAAEPALASARRSSLTALVHFYEARQIALTRARLGTEYSSIIGRIFSAQNDLEQLHRDPFVPTIDHIRAAERVMKLKVELSRIELEVLDRDAGYRVAWDQLLDSAEVLRDAQQMSEARWSSDGQLLAALVRLRRESDRLLAITPS